MMQKSKQIYHIKITGTVMNGVSWINEAEVKTVMSFVKVRVEDI